MNKASNQTTTQELLESLTEEEKRLLCTGRDFWNTAEIPQRGIYGFMMNDGPHGVRATRSSNIIVTDNEASTAFPTGSALGASWNPELIGKVAAAIGREAGMYGIRMILGPGINLKRSPLGGRNFEYFSEDPYLTGELATAFVREIQGEGIGACLKHFICNEQEIERMSINCVVDERALREVYAQPFSTCIKNAQPVAVMAAYNSLNGEFIIESERYLKGLLRETLGFQGAVISDWGAVRNESRSSRATLDLTMPGRGYSLALEVLEGEVLNARAGRVLTLMKSVGDGKPKSDMGAVHTSTKKAKEVLHDELERNYHLALEAAEESIVLLRNEEAILPIKGNQKRIGVIGNIFEKPRLQGGGSSKVLPYKAPSPAEVLKQHCIEIDFNHGTDVAEAVGVVERNDTNLVFVGLSDLEETEGRDRTTYYLSDCQEKLLETLLEVDPNIVVIVNAGTAVGIKCIDSIRALLMMWLPGEAGSQALINILFGKVSPSGRLSETIPRNHKDFPIGGAAKSSNRCLYYSEGILIGHRYYDYKDITPAFSFGFGLSYTQFEYSHPSITKNRLTDEEIVSVSFSLKNCGDRYGKDVPQLYIQHKNPLVIKPLRTLRRFKKIELGPGEEKIVEFTLNREDFSYFNDEIDDFFVDEGRYLIHIGPSSGCLPLILAVDIEYSKTSQKMLEQRLDCHSPCKKYLETPRVKKHFEKTFGHLKNQNLYEIVMEMPLGLLHNLFPDLVTKKEIDDLMDAVHRC